MITAKMNTVTLTPDQLTKLQYSLASSTIAFKGELKVEPKLLILPRKRLLCFISDLGRN